MMALDPLATALWEADRHLDVLETALRDWQQAPATPLEELEADQDRLGCSKAKTQGCHNSQRSTAAGHENR